MRCILKHLEMPFSVFKDAAKSMPSKSAVETPAAPPQNDPPAIVHQGS